MMIVTLILFTAFASSADAAGWESAAPNALIYKAAAKTPTGGTINVWFYLPSKRKGKLPCVFIAPAGSRLFHGMTLASGDQPEHIPFVQAGYAVVAYDIEGPCEADSGPAVKAAITKFRAADAGVVDAKVAISKALSDIADIDPNKLYVSGHSSAATLALQVAAKDPRIKGCIAFAPCTNELVHFGPQIQMLDMMSPGFSKFITSVSPHNLAKDIRCPVFLFHADDDENVPAEDNQSFATALQKSGNTKLTFVRVKSGGHFDSMISQGFPLALQWLQKQTN